MSDEAKVDFSRFTGSRIQGKAESEEASRGQNPEQHLRPRVEVERHPGYFQRKQEREGNSEWSGASAGGGTWAGRSR